MNAENENETRISQNVMRMKVHKGKKMFNCIGKTGAIRCS